MALGTQKSSSYMYNEDLQVLVVITDRELCELIERALQSANRAVCEARREATLVSRKLAALQFTQLFAIHVLHLLSREKL